MEEIFFLIIIATNRIETIAEMWPFPGPKITISLPNPEESRPNIGLLFRSGHWEV